MCEVGHAAGSQARFKPIVISLQHLKTDYGLILTNVIQARIQVST